MPDMTTLDLDFQETVTATSYMPTQVLRIAPKRIDTPANWDSLHNTGLYRAEFYFSNKYKFDNGTNIVDQVLPTGSIPDFSHHVQIDAKTSVSDWVTFSIEYDTADFLTLMVRTKTGQNIQLASYPRPDFQNEDHLRLSLLYNSTNGSFVLYFNDENRIDVPQSCNIDPTSLTLFSFGTRLFDTFVNFSDAIIDFGFVTTSPYRQELALGKPLIRKPNALVPFSYEFDDAYDYDNESYFTFDDHGTYGQFIADVTNPNFSKLSIDNTSGNNFTFSKPVQANIGDLIGINGSSADSSIAGMLHPASTAYHGEIRTAFDGLLNGDQVISISHQTKGNIVPKTLPSPGDLIGMQVNFTVPSWIDSYVLDSSLPTGTSRSLRQRICLGHRSTVGDNFDTSDPDQAFGPLSQLFVYKKEIAVEFVIRTSIDKSFTPNGTDYSRFESYIRLSRGNIIDIVDQFSETNLYYRQVLNYLRGLAPDQERIIPLSSSLIPGDVVKIGVYLNPKNGAVGLTVNGSDRGFIIDPFLSGVSEDTGLDTRPFEISASVVEHGHDELKAPIPNAETEMKLILNGSGMDIAFPLNTYDLNGTQLTNTGSAPVVDSFSVATAMNTSVSGPSPYRFFETTASQTIRDQGFLNQSNRLLFSIGNVNSWEPVSGLFSHTIQGTDIADRKTIAPIIRRGTTTAAIHNCGEYLNKFRWFNLYENNQLSVNPAYLDGGKIESGYPLNSGIFSFPLSSTIIGIEMNVESFFNNVEFVSESTTSQLSASIGLGSMSQDASTSPPNYDTRSHMTCYAKLGVETFGDFSEYGNKNTKLFCDFKVGQSWSPLVDDRVVITPIDNLGNTIDLASQCVIGLYFDKQVNRFGAVVNGHDQGFITPPFSSSQFTFERFSPFVDIVEQGVSISSPDTLSAIEVSVNTESSDMVHSFPPGTVDILGNPIGTSSAPVDHLGQTVWVTGSTPDPRDAVLSFNATTGEERHFMMSSSGLSAPVLCTTDSYLYVSDNSAIHAFTHSGAYQHKLVDVPGPFSRNVISLTAGANDEVFVSTSYGRVLKYDSSGTEIFNIAATITNSLFVQPIRTVFKGSELFIWFSDSLEVVSATNGSLISARSINIDANNAVNMTLSSSNMLITTTTSTTSYPPTGTSSNWTTSAGGGAFPDFGKAIIAAIHNPTSDKLERVLFNETQQNMFLDIVNPVTGNFEDEFTIPLGATEELTDCQIFAHPTNSNIRYLTCFIKNTSPSVSNQLIWFEVDTSGPSVQFTRSPMTDGKGKYLTGVVDSHVHQNQSF